MDFFVFVMIKKLKIQEDVIIMLDIQIFVEIYISNVDVWILVVNIFEDKIQLMGRVLNLYINKYKSYQNYLFQQKK